VCTPKKNGGLGVKDLAVFSRALRLRWLWFDWQAPDHPYLEWPSTPISPKDLSLFRECTQILLGSGKKALFWKDNWHNGRVLQASFPELFKLARRKNISVHDALDNGRWMKGLRRINSPQQIEDFVSLWQSAGGSAHPR